MGNADDRFVDRARERGIVVEAVHYPAGTRTAADAAAAVGCDVAQIVKSLVLVGPDGPVLALTAGHHRVDLDRVAAIVGGDVRMASPDEARAATGFAIGGTPPFGHPAPLPTLLDPSLTDHGVVWAAAGTPATCFPIEPDRLVEATGARVEAFTADEA